MNADAADGLTAAERAVIVARVSRLVDVCMFAARYHHAAADASSSSFSSNTNTASMSFNAGAIDDDLPLVATPAWCCVGRLVALPWAHAHASLGRALLIPAVDEALHRLSRLHSFAYDTSSHNGSGSGSGSDSGSSGSRNSSESDSGKESGDGPSHQICQLTAFHALSAFWTALGDHREAAKNMVRYLLQTKFRPYPHSLM
jgi:hypothetical protein